MGAVLTPGPTPSWGACEPWRTPGAREGVGPTRLGRPRGSPPPPWLPRRLIGPRELARPRLGGELQPPGPARLHANRALSFAGERVGPSSSPGPGRSCLFGSAHRRHEGRPKAKQGAHGTSLVHPCPADGDEGLPVAPLTKRREPGIGVSFPPLAREPVAPGPGSGQRRNMTAAFRDPRCEGRATFPKRPMIRGCKDIRAGTC